MKICSICSSPWRTRHRPLANSPAASSGSSSRHCSAVMSRSSRLRCSCSRRLLHVGMDRDRRHRKADCSFLTAVKALYDARILTISPLPASILQHEEAQMGTAEPQVAAAGETQVSIDGFQLVIDALKLNGIDTIYGLPGIPITDLTRRAQAAGLRVLSFRHEQNAGYAASIAGFLTQKPGICLTVSAPGFLNGLNALAHATRQLLPDDPDQRLERARDRRPAAGRLRGDGPARDRQAASPRRRSACCMPRTSASASRAPSAPQCRAARAASTSICRPSCFAQSIDARRRQELVDQGRRSGAAADPRRRKRSSARSIC